MSKFKYPVDTDQFQIIREQGLLYVDKTDLMFDLANRYRYVFLARPRRFGKSLLCNTFKAYFQGQKELFNGLKVMNLEKEWTKFPVLHFDMSELKNCTNIQSMRNILSDMIARYEEQFGAVKMIEEEGARFRRLLEHIYSSMGKQVVVLIDEYDAPLLDVAHEKEKLDELRNTMRNFYSPLKGNESKIRFLFMTGITKFSSFSIFSELNNITNISMDEPYAGICGITKEEMLTQMSDDIDALAEHLEQSREETIQELKDHYDGYHFTWPSPDVFNPYSLLNCFADGKLKAYWFGSGTPTYLIEKMREFHVLPSQLGRVRAKASSFDAATERMTSLTPLLYQSGYLTIKDYEKKIDVYTLDFPNKEIEVGLFDSLLPGYLGSGIDTGRVVIADISSYINSGKMDEALQMLADFLETIPYCDNTNYEGHYQQMFYIIFALLTDYNIIVEQHTAKGRIDITMETADTIYVMELKFNKSAQEALDQINDKHYAQAFALKNKEIVKVGLNFSVKDEVNTLEWVIS